MRFSSALLAAAAVFTTVDAQNGYKGFNYGAFFNNQAPKHRADFEYEFNAAKQLPGTNGGFTSARLYTMIQWGTQNTVIEAIQAAINTKTTLLLGMWASSGQANFNNEIAALKSAIQQYGRAFTDLVVGISVGSEDLYRITPTSIQNGGGPGAQPAELLNYIRQTRDAIRGTPLQGKPIGHVDTWTAYVNASNNAVISALDFLGVDAYPYFQTTMANSIGNANKTFYDAFQATIKAAQGKPVWVTETGWPVSGATQNQAVASADNARIYWQDVSCSLMAKNVNFYYYMLQEAQYGNPSPDFGIKGAGDLMQIQPRFNLACPGTPRAFPVIPPPPVGAPAITGGPASPHNPINLPIPQPLNVPINLTGPFEVPHLIVPIDKINPTGVLGNQFIARLSGQYSSLYNFDVGPQWAGRTCHLVFHLPAAPYLPGQHFQLNAPGGIRVSQLETLATPTTSAGTAGNLLPVGSVDRLNLGQGHLISSGPCQAGRTVGYQVDSINGLDLSYFQMAIPAAGLFMTVS